jgi:hypothetical protein
MGKINLLISQGCSFTQVPNTNKNWPIFLRDKLGVPAFFDGIGSAGNDLISRRTIYRVHQCLNDKKIPAEKLLVGVMWSGVNRHSFYLNREPINYTKLSEAAPDELLHSIGNPNAIIDGTKRNNYIISPHWKDELSTTYYKKFHDEIGSLLYTLEHVLKVQTYLKLNNIKYFFTNYNYDTFNAALYKSFRNHPDLKYLYDQLDYENFLPVEHMGIWNREESGLKFEMPDDDHPTDEMSRMFTEKIIMPHLEQKGWL